MNDARHAASWHFADRADAGRQLAEVLADYRDQHPLVLAIPRGGIPIGRVVADALDGELDVVLVRKLGSPANGDVAVGAVDERGRVQLTARGCANGVGSDYVRAETARQLAAIRKRRVAYSAGRRPVAATGRVVIVVDDGLATGATMRAALAAVREQRPAVLVSAVPVASARGLDLLTGVADEVVCLHAPAYFRAVGACYGDFQPVDDADVLRLLRAPSRPSADLPTGKPLARESPERRPSGSPSVRPRAG